MTGEMKKKMERGKRNPETEKKRGERDAPKLVSMLHQLPKHHAGDIQKAGLSREASLLETNVLSYLKKKEAERSVGVREVNVFMCLIDFVPVVEKVCV